VPFRLEFTIQAITQIKQIENSDPKKHKKIKKALGYLETNPRHPSLNTHKFQSVTGPNGEDAFEAYVENNTPAAGRILWCYKKGIQGTMVIVAVIAHP